VSLQRENATSYGLDGLTTHLLTVTFGVITSLFKFSLKYLHLLFTKSHSQVNSKGVQQKLMQNIKIPAKTDHCKLYS